MRYKEHIWYFSVIQRVDLSNLLAKAIIILTDVCGAIKLILLRSIRV
jgi:hypothetical protein